MIEIAELIKNEKAGEAQFFIGGDSPAFDKNVKEAPVLYKLLGESRFRVVRNNKFELAFVHLTEDWMRQARIDLTGMDCSKGLDVKITWGSEENCLSVKVTGEKDFVRAVAVQIDN